MLDDIAKGVVEGLISGILSRKSKGDPGHVEVQSLVLRDENGVGRAVLAMLDGNPTLSFLDPNEQVRAVICTDADGPYAQLWGENGGVNMLLRLENDSADLSFYDENHEQRVSMQLDPDGPSILLRDADGKCRIQAAVDDEGSPSVTLYDQNEQQVAEIPIPE